METTLKMIMEKLEIMDAKMDRMNKDITDIKQGQLEFRMETRVKFKDSDASFNNMDARFDRIDDALEDMAEEIEAVVLINGKMEHKVTILNNRYIKTKLKQDEDLL